MYACRPARWKICAGNATRKANHTKLATTFSNPTTVTPKINLVLEEINQQIEIIQIRRNHVNANKTKKKNPVRVGTPNDDSNKDQQTNLRQKSRSDRIDQLETRETTPLPRKSKPRDKLEGRDLEHRAEECSLQRKTRCEGREVEFPEAKPPPPLSICFAGAAYPFHTSAGLRPRRIFIATRVHCY